MNKRRLIFIFLDGVGIGKSDDENPFYAVGADYLPFFSDGKPASLPDLTPVKPIDACLGVEGIPMSATGQTSLFTGINVPQILDCHKDSYPNDQMRRIINGHNIFFQLRTRNRSVQFLNAYPDCAHIFNVDYVRIREDGKLIFSDQFPRRLRSSISVTSCMMLANRMPPFGKEDILEGRALYHDFSNRLLLAQGMSLPEFTPGQAAEVISHASEAVHFTLYEFFQTDLFGHGGTMEECKRLIADLNDLVKRLVQVLDKDRDTLLITSDHGNLEDYSTRLHTENPVPLLAWGYGSDHLRASINSLVDVKPAILDFFTN